MDICLPKAERDFEPAQTLQLIRSSGPICWSWGMHAVEIYGKKGLMFTVNGHHHKGYVFIALSFMDTFTVLFINKQGDVLDEYKDVYVDELVKTIDVRVEKMPDYRF